MKLSDALGAHLLALALTLTVTLVSACAGQPADPTPAQAPTARPTLPRPTATLRPATATLRPPTATQPPTATLAPSPTSTLEEPISTPTEESSRAAEPDLPAPPDAAGVTYDPGARELNYTSPTGIVALAEFFRQALPEKGWEEDASAAEVADNYGSLEFTRGDASLAIMLTYPGGTVETAVTVDVSGLPELAQGVAEVTPGVVSARLKAVDKDGFPLPEDYTSYEGENSLFRFGAKVSSPSPLKAVLALLRVELAARKWAELPATVAATDDRASLLFENPDQGKLELKLTKNDAGGTDVVLTMRSEPSARAAGVLPPAGKARIYFGNITGGPVVFTIDYQEIEVPVDAPGRTSMEGVPFVDLAPGAHDFSLGPVGKAATNDRIEAGAGEVWALLAGPGGALSIQMY